MKYVSKDELIQILMQENATIKAQGNQNSANLDYVAMMAEIGLPAESEADHGAQ